MSEPVRKTLSVLRHLSAHGGEAVVPSDLADACAVPPATLSRMLVTLQSEGLILRPSRSVLLPQFTLEERAPLPGELREIVEQTLDDLAKETRQSAELIAIQGNGLRWVEKVEHPDLAIRLRAAPGFRRGLNELDCLTRLAGAVMGWEALLKTAQDGFYTTGEPRRGVTISDACDRINATDPNAVAYDPDGNRLGVRRFVARVRLGVPTPFILSIAEPALARTEGATHAEHQMTRLRAAVASLEHRAHRPPNN